MFYNLSRIVGFLTTPSNVILAVGLLGIILLLTSFANLGRRLLVTGYALFAIIGLSPIGYALTLPLEERFPQWDTSRGAPDGIIVLGGVIDTELGLARGEISLHEAAERVTAVAGLARRFPNTRIVFSGGDANLPPSEADVAARLFEDFGILPERILKETHSRNTAENASFTKALVNPQVNERWLLVTSALHMPRSVGAFRRIGFPVEAYPVDWQTRGRQDLLSLFGSPLGGAGFGRRRHA
jgi:uncharacterized SAM-binding protein YcdF (DUF218 family)